MVRPGPGPSVARTCALSTCLLRYTARFFDRCAELTPNRSSGLASICAGRPRLAQLTRNGRVCSLGKLEARRYDLEVRAGALVVPLLGGTDQDDGPAHRHTERRSVRRAPRRSLLSAGGAERRTGRNAGAVPTRQRPGPGADRRGAGANARPVARRPLPAGGPAG
jgi:hypothetical protein